MSLLAVVVLTAGCRTLTRDCPPLKAGQRAVDAHAPPPGPADGRTSPVESLRRLSNMAAALPGEKRNYLALSGGGKYGAFTVGLLSGWTDTGTRPSFDVVTGVSTGALIASFAFLGPEYDRLLLHYYSTSTPDRVFRRKWLARALFSDSLALSDPLKQRVEEIITPEILRRVAAEHARGRRLYVGTTNLDTKKLVIWDMGAIASTPGPDSLRLYRDVVLASSAVPGLFPPVEIPVRINGERFTELHADGGLTASVFFRASMLGLRPEEPLWARSGSNLYIVVAGKTYAEPRCVERRLIDIANTSIASMLYAASRNDLIRMFMLSLSTGVAYRETSIPAEYEDKYDSMSFRADEMAELISLGMRIGRSGPAAWRDYPPEISPDEREPARTGTDLRVLSDRPGGR